MEKKKVLVIGAGVIGLTHAIALLSDTSGLQFDVTLCAKSLSPHTVSDCAGAVWGPYACGADLDAAAQASIDRWALATYDHYHQRYFAAGNDNQAGVQFLPMRHFMAGPDAEAVRQRQGALWPASATPPRVEISRVPQEALPEGAEVGFVAENTPFVDPSRYLQHLLGEFLRLGGRLRIRELAGMRGAARAAEEEGFEVVLNAAGMGAADFVAEEEREGEARGLQPGAGFFVLCKAPWVRGGITLDAGDRMSYVIPRADGVVLVGGTNLPTRETAPEPGQFARIMDAAARLLPSMAQAVPVHRGCGLRPVRAKGPRCEAQRVKAGERGGFLLVHAYGCGGSGYTLCWGMAHTCLGLILRHFIPSIPSKL